MAKDKIYGAIILIIAALVLVWYTLYAVVYGGLFAGDYGWMASMWGEPLTFAITLGGRSWRWAVIGPLYLAAVLILGIAMWIGYTMLTTPPPVPLEELEELGLEEEESEE
ncbi:MAG: hypothetical protein EU547_02425 [Promethearchaeota archaeon]|nr:MAG: hypothetical protein EU547_02425 [Candidatus Lokiarchaeota archaeon]